MESFNLSSAIKEIYQSQLRLFTIKTLKDLIPVKKESTFFKYLNQLVKKRVLIKISRGKYLLNNVKVSDFELANFLYPPSYISFETALNFWGILSQFPYEIASATSRKTVVKNFEGKIFSYSHLDKSLFWGFKKVESFLIASKEKAFVDQLYLYAKGLKRINWDELNYQEINKDILRAFLQKYPQTKQFSKAINLLKTKLGL